MSDKWPSHLHGLLKAIAESGKIVSLECPSEGVFEWRVTLWHDIRKTADPRKHKTVTARSMSVEEFSDPKNCYHALTSCCAQMRELCGGVIL